MYNKNGNKSMLLKIFKYVVIPALCIVLAGWLMFNNLKLLYFLIGSGALIGFVSFTNNSMKEKDGLGTIITYGILFVPIAALMFLLAFTNSDGSSKTSPGYDIDSYTVILDVGIDNKVNVTERINTNFYNYDKHGIYKFTPYWLEYTGKDGKTIKRKSSIINLRAENDPYTITEVNGKSRIKIGDANYTVHGNKTYVIKYTYDMGKDPFDGFDEFIFHAFGDYWDVAIKNPRIIINMPKPIDGNVINVYRDKYRSSDINDLVNIEVLGNSITITFKDSDRSLYDALTVDVELPEGYFVGGSFNYGWISFIICMVVLGLTGVVIYIWSKHGKNYKKRVPTVEFYAPDNLNSAEVGYIYNNRRVTKKLTISLIIQLASKKYIKIDELKGKSKKDDKIVITNIGKENGKKVDGLSDCEKVVYEYLFTSSKNKTSILNDNKRFYKAFEYVNSSLTEHMSKKVYDEDTKSKRMTTIYIAIATLLLSIISFSFIKDMDPKLNIIYYISFACVLVNVFIIFIMGRKTEYGEIISARVKGFRDFLETVEKEKLDALVEQNPDYFYDILPYTYVLNISKKWIKKFENIPIDKAYLGNINYINGDNLFSIIDDAIIYTHERTYTSHSSSNSSSSGCSSCGGGCSSCGGGCSSCGGGGSW